jgi:hypothetical protein
VGRGATGAPDVANVVVSDTTQGLITFQLDFVPGTEQQAQDRFNVYIDSDQNPTTGDVSGAGTEYLLQYDGLPGGGLELFKWDGKSSYQFVKSPSLRGSFTGDAQYFSMAASELGIGDGFNFNFNFNFNVAAAVGEDPATSSQVDFLPENGTNFHYSMQSKAVIRLNVADWEDSSAPRAGKPYTTALEKGFLKVAWYKGAFTSPRGRPSVSQAPRRRRCSRSASASRPLRILIRALDWGANTPG